MVQKLFANAKKFSLGCGPPDAVKKLSGWLDADTQVIHILLHLLDLGGFADVRRANRVIEGTHVIQHIQAARDEKRLALLMLPDLMKEPRIANRAAPNHESTRA